MTWCEYLCQLIMCKNESNLQTIIGNLFTHKVVINLKKKTKQMSGDTYKNNNKNIRYVIEVQKPKQLMIFLGMAPVPKNQIIISSPQ